MKRTLLLCLIAVITAITPIFTSSFATAQTTPTDPQTTTQNTPEQPVNGALCERVQTRLLTRINKVSELRDTHGEVYDTLLQRLDKVIDNAETKSYDTTQLSDARETVAAAIADYDKAVDALTTSLSTSAEVSCENPIRYVLLITNARTELKTVREASQAVRTAFVEEVIPTLKEYKTWLQAEQSGENE